MDRRNRAEVYYILILVGFVLFLTMIWPSPEDKIFDLIVEGGVALGAVIAWIVVHFIRRFGAFNPRSLGSVVSIIVGGAITNFLGIIGSDAKVGAWAGYTVGLLLGVFLFGVLGPESATPEDLQVRKTQASEESYESLDPRLKTLDQLHERQRAGALTFEEFFRLKKSLLTDIERNPPAKAKDAGGI